MISVRRAVGGSMQNGTRQFFHSDMSGNIRMLSDGSGAVTDTYLYSAFGEQVSTSGGSSNPYRFGGDVGYYTDKVSRVYVRARHYAPAQARWLSQDPIGFGGGDWNLFRYVGNSPSNLVDPSGLASTPINPITVIPCTVACVLGGGFTALAYSGCKCGGSKNACETALCMLETFAGLDDVRRNEISAGFLGCMACVAPKVGSILQKVRNSPILQGCLGNAVLNTVPDMYVACRQGAQSDLAQDVCNLIGGCAGGMITKGHILWAPAVAAVTQIGCNEAAIQLQERFGPGRRKAPPRKTPPRKWPSRLGAR